MGPIRTRLGRRQPPRALTLVEVIGVLAIMAIIASFVAPSLIRQVQTATAAGEDAKLEDIAQALTNGIRATGLIPNPNLDPAATNATAGCGWAYLASNYTRLVGDNLFSVFPGLTNDTRRRLYLSANLAGVASNGGFNRTISNWGAVVFPTNAKMFLISSSRPDFALALSPNGPGVQDTNNSYAATVVASLESWNKVVSNGTVAAPTNLVDGWTNKGEFLHVRTIDLAPIFNEVRAAQQKALEQEDKNLEEIARALLVSIQATGVIPDPAINAASGWVSQIAGYSSMGANEIQYAFPSSLVGERRLYLDASLSSFIGPIPADGWSNTPVAPASAYFVSCSKEDNSFLNPSTANGGTAITTNGLNFLRTWQKAPDSTGFIVASNNEIVAPDWINRGEFLNIKAVDLRNLYCLIQLEDSRSPGFIQAVLNPGSSYGTPGPTFINTNGVTISVSFSGSTNTNLSISFASVVSPPGKVLWADTISNSPVSMNLSNSIPVPGGVGGLLELVFPATPSFSISTNPLVMMTSQTIAFYVLKGTRINLGNSALVQQQSIVANQDASFRFLNGTWNQIY